MQLDDCLPKVRTGMYELCLYDSPFKGANVAYTDDLLSNEWSVNKKCVPFKVAIEAAQKHDITIRRKDWSPFTYVRIYAGFVVKCTEVLRGEERFIDETACTEIDDLLAEDWEICD